MPTLIVTLPQAPAEPATLFDYVLTADGSTLSAQSSAPLALLPQADEVVAVVPAQRLSWHQVQLPQGTLGRGFGQHPARLRAVLEGLLEDRVLDETQQLHFALEPRPNANGPVWVAVCERAWLQAALQALEQCARPVSRIVPQFAPDTLQDNLHVTGDPEQAHMVFLARGAVNVLPLSATSVAMLDWPAGQAVVAEPTVAALAETLFKRPVTLQQAAQQRLQASQSAWDLAQFDLANSSSARSWKRVSESVAAFLRAPRWRAARLVSLTLLLVNLAGLNAWAWKTQNALSAQRVAVREVLVNTFPNVKVVVDAPLQMAREVALLERASGTASGRDLEAMLGAFGTAAPVDTSLTAIEFVSGEVRMKGLRMSPDELTAIGFQLKGLGFEARSEGDNVLLKPGATP